MRAYAGKGLTAVAVMAAGWMLAPAGFTDSQESHRGQDVIKACVAKRGGEARIVPPGRPCRDDETAVVWNIEGPAGQQGPPGAPGPRGRDGRDGQDGRDGKDGKDGKDGGGTPAAAGPIGTLNVEGIHAPDQPSPILSVSGGLSNSESVLGGPGGGGSGKVNFQDLHVTKPVDKFSPKLYMFGASGEHIRDVDINVFRQGTEDVELNYHLQDAFVSSIQQSGGGNSTPVESLSFSFSRIRLTFTPLGGSPVTFCYDLKVGKAC